MNIICYDDSYTQFLPPKKQQHLMLGDSERKCTQEKKNKKNTYLFLISCDLWIEKLQASVNLNTQQTHIKDLN